MTYCVLIALWAAVLGETATSRPTAGDVAPVEVRVAADRAIEKLRAAMRAKDADGVERATAALSEALGSWAGVPDRAPVFASPPDAETPITRERLEKLWVAEWTAAQKTYRSPGRWGLPAGKPEVDRALLRETAYVISGGLAGLRHRLGDSAEVRRKVDEGLAHLLEVQRPDGLFPFADLRASNRHFRGPLESLYRQHPEAFQDGWVVEDYGDGGLQFDNGVCAAILLDAYEQLGDERYLRAAQKACRWAVGRPVVANWNYNAFSVWALARYVEVTGDREFLQPAVERARLGVLPGQLPGGRWVDQHNARTVYHAILLRGLAVLYRVMPEGSPDRARVADAVRRAEGVLVDELYEHGASDADHSLTALYAVERAFGPSQRRAGAMRIIVNAMIARASAGGRGGVEDVGMLAAGQALDVFAGRSSSRPVD